MLLVIDNHDSFTWNLVHLLRRCADDVEVVQRDTITLDEVRARAPRAVVHAPGYGHPEQAELALRVVRELVDVPQLGVCLGHQVLCAALGARVVRGARPMHGRTSLIRHGGEGVFSGLPSPMTVARYHSLVVDAGSLPPSLRATAFADDGALMAVRHLTRPLEGVQFHPESFMTEHGARLVAQFVARCPPAGAKVPAELPEVR